MVEMIHSGSMRAIIRCHQGGQPGPGHVDLILIITAFGPRAKKSPPGLTVIVIITLTKHMQSIDEAGQAGAQVSEVEITPEMIEAGVNAYDLFLSLTAVMGRLRRFIEPWSLQNLPPRLGV